MPSVVVLLYVPAAPRTRTVASALPALVAPDASVIVMVSVRSCPFVCGLAASFLNVIDWMASWY
jgi:hypothetical protein